MGARMGSMYRLKAYFGMVPAEELAEYADEPYTPPARRTVRDYAAEHDPEPRDRETVSRWDDRYVADDDRYDAEESWERRSARPVEEAIMPAVAMGPIAHLVEVRIERAGRNFMQQRFPDVRMVLVDQDYVAPAAEVRA